MEQNTSETQSELPDSNNSSNNSEKGVSTEGHQNIPQVNLDSGDASITAIENKKAKRAALLIVFLVVVIDLLGFGIVLPLLPRYADEIVPAETPKAIKGIITGSMLSIFSAMQFLFAPIWGRWSDRVGRRPVLLIGLIGSVIFYLLFGLVSHYLITENAWFVLGLIFLTRLGAGVCGATISTAAAVVADCTSKEKRAHGMALIGAAFGIGFTVGPLVAFAALSIFDKHLGTPGYTASFLSLLALIIGYIRLPETLTTQPDAAHRRRWKFMELWQALKLPTIGILIICFFLATFGFANFESTLSNYTKRTFQLTDRQNFLVFAYVGFALMFSQGYLYRKCVKKMKEVQLIRIGLVGMFSGLFSLALLALVGEEIPIFLAKIWFAAALAVAVFGFAFLNPSINSLISKSADPARQGEILGITQSFSALARILGPLIGLGLFELGFHHILPYIFASLLLFIVLFQLPKLNRQPELS